MDFSLIERLMRSAGSYGHERLRNAGFSDTEHRICAFVYFHGTTGQQNIVSALLADKTTVAKALASLEDKGLVVRTENESNRRKKNVELTEAGRLSMKNVAHIYDEWTDAVTGCLDAEEQEDLSRYLERMLKKAEEISGVINS